MSSLGLERDVGTQSGEDGASEVNVVDEASVERVVASEECLA